MGKVPILPESDIAKLKGLLRQPGRSEPISSTGVSRPIDQTRNYIVFTSESLPAATDDADVRTPGTAELPVYRINDDGKLEAVLDDADQPVKEEVFNLSDAAVDAEKYLVVSQERHTGRLVYDGSGSSDSEIGDTDVCGGCDGAMPVGSVVIDDKKYAFTYGYTAPADDIPAGEVDRNEDDANWQADSFEVECVADEPPPDDDEGGGE